MSQVDSRLRGNDKCFNVWISAFAEMTLGRDSLFTEGFQFFRQFFFADEFRRAFFAGWR